jgi:RNA polymerase-binding transcription factor DksA
VAKKVNKNTTQKTAKKKAVKKKVAKKKTAQKVKTKKASAKKKTAKPKKQSVKKTSSRRARKVKSSLTKKELGYFRDLLIEKLKEITGSVNHIEMEALKTSRLDSTGDLSSMPIHMADIGSDNYEQEFALGLMDSERKIVAEIYDALNRIQHGTYGICEGTGEPIPKLRLEGIPWTRYCVKYAEMLEKGLVEEPEHNYFYDDDEDEEDNQDWFDDDQDDEDEDEDEDRDAFFYGYDDEDEEEDEQLR